MDEATAGVDLDTDDLIQVNLILNKMYMKH